MSFIKKGFRALGGLLGGGIMSLFGGRKKKEPLALPRPATRDDAALLAERDKELAKRRGAGADRIPGASGEPAGGLGRMIMGS